MRWGMVDPFITNSEIDPETAAYIAAVEEGIADADAGRTIPYEVVRRWMLTWGTEYEQPPPKFPGDED